MTTVVAPENEIRETKRMSVSLTAGGMRLTLLARRTRTGGETQVITTDAKGKSTRGMTERHDTFEAAVDALGNLVQEANRQGWRRTERAGGFKAKPDVFSSMPAAPGAAPAVDTPKLVKKGKRS